MNRLWQLKGKIIFIQETHLTKENVIKVDVIKEDGQVGYFPQLIPILEV